MGKGKIFLKYEIVLKGKGSKLKIKKNVAVLFMVLFIVKINYEQAQRI